MLLPRSGSSPLSQRQIPQARRRTDTLHKFSTVYLFVRLKPFQFLFSASVLLFSFTTIFLGGTTDSFSPIGATACATWLWLLMNMSSDLAMMYSDLSSLSSVLIWLISRTDFSA